MPMCASLLSICVLLAAHFGASLGLRRIAEFQRYDGWYNNLENPHWGSVGAILRHETSTRFADDAYKMLGHLPSARRISDELFRGPSGIPNKRNLTALFAFFSQVVSYEIVDSTENSCPMEMVPIPVPNCDRVFDRQCTNSSNIPYIRAKYAKGTGIASNVPRRQVNERTSWVDASFLYGTSDPWVAALRSWKNGTLAEGKKPGYPRFNTDNIPLKNPPLPQIDKSLTEKRLYVFGDARINENSGLLGLGIIFFRWHNVQAKHLQAENPEWTDEELFQGARRWVIATMQKIFFYDYLPVLLNDLVPSYEGYKPFVPPGVSNSYATAASEYMTTLIPPAIFLRDQKCRYRTDIMGYPSVRLCQNWWDGQDVVERFSVEEVILGLSSQIAEAEDMIVVEDLRDFAPGPLYFSRSDRIAATIMRCRDNGLASYEELHKALNLPEIDWSKKNQSQLQKVRDLYGENFREMSAFVGGMMETADGPGPLFTAILRDQFFRVRDGDRFWFENRQNGIFTEKEIAQIRETSFSDIVKATTSIDDDALQKNVFIWSHNDAPCPQPHQINSTEIEECVPLMRFDHFAGSEVCYIYVCIFLILIPIACFGIAQFLVNRTHPARFHFSKLFAKSVAKHCASASFCFAALEWIGDFTRSVRVVVTPKTKRISVEKPRGGVVLQMFDLKDVTSFEMKTSDPKQSAKPIVVISVPKHFDVVVIFESWKNFSEFSDALRSLEVPVTVKRGEEEEILKSAQTKKQRQKQLANFFREAYSELCREQRVDGRASMNQSPSISDSVLSTRLTKTEFAEALGMRDCDVFVERMFSCVAEPDSSHLTFAQFLSILERFMRGSVRGKLEFLFAMCDFEGRGRISKSEFCALIRGSNLPPSADVDGIVDEILNQSGVSVDEESISKKEFEALFGGVEQIGLHLKGANLKIRCENKNQACDFTDTDQRPPWHRSNAILALLTIYRQHIVILIFYFALNFFVFIDRFWLHYYGAQHRQMHLVMGVGIALARGSAGGISLNMAIILLTVCRNLITRIRETPLGEYVPFDAAIAFHKIVAFVIAFWSLLHSVAHYVNFYNLGTQSREDLRCVFREEKFSSDFFPSLSYWFFATPTGITSVLLIATISIVYVFALEFVRRRSYSAFRITHFFTIAFFALTVLHGLPKLFGTPQFLYFTSIPIVIFVVDRIVGVRQEYKFLEIVDAAVLPSDIVHVRFTRPRGFIFKSGQWIRVACPSIQPSSLNPKHAFSIASAPSENTVDLYIKAVGNWTKELRSLVLQALNSRKFPSLHLIGPYGDGNQTWQDFEVTVMIGAGIGVTPFASTLRDLAHKLNATPELLKTQKVYFVWVCPSHRSFEWFVDVLREVEESTADILQIDIFITQAFHKFDLRTTMMYICENEFRTKNSGKSIFTGLRATNHFERPNFTRFLRCLSEEHSKVREIGVFSCGPATINQQIRSSCIEANNNRSRSLFVHNFESF